MIFSLDVRPARKGDCMLLHFGSKEEPGLVMIDGGPKSVYKPYLKPRIQQIRQARNLSDRDRLLVDLLMVSHVDDDHIHGILELTNEEIAAKQSRRPQLLNVQSFWHNSFDEIIKHDPNKLTASIREHFGESALSGGGSLSDAAALDVEEHSFEHPEVVTSGLKVLASIEQGFRLRQNAEGLNYPRNPEFEGNLIVACKNGKPKSIAQNLEFTVVGPMQSDLDALRKKHTKWLDSLKEKGESPPAALAAFVDKSVPNLSSIVVVAELKGKTMLLTGDARGDKILEGLQLVGLLGSGSRSKIQVDLLKVPHHGSSNNLETSFFERIIAYHYVFSGNGEHGNPERESLEMLLAARGSADYRIHLTYPIKEIDIERKHEWQKEQVKERNRKKTTHKSKSSKQTVRPNWSPKKQSLEDLFKQHKDFAKKIRVVDQGEPYVIDLLEKVGY